MLADQPFDLVVDRARQIKAKYQLVDAGRQGKVGTNGHTNQDSGQFSGFHMGASERTRQSNFKGKNRGNKKVETRHTFGAYISSYSSSSGQGLGCNSYGSAGSSLHLALNVVGLIIDLV